LWALRDELEDFPQMLMKPMGVNPRGVHASGDQSPSGLASCASSLRDSVFPGPTLP